MWGGQTATSQCQTVVTQRPGGRGVGGVGGVGGLFRQGWEGGAHDLPGPQSLQTAGSLRPKPRCCRSSCKPRAPGRDGMGEGGRWLVLLTVSVCVYL